MNVRPQQQKYNNINWMRSVIYAQGRFISWKPEGRPGQSESHQQEQVDWIFNNAPAGLPGHADALQIDVRTYFGDYTN